MNIYDLQIEDNKVIIAGATRNSAWAVIKKGHEDEVAKKLAACKNEHITYITMEQLANLVEAWRFMDGSHDNDTVHVTMTAGVTKGDKYKILRFTGLGGGQVGFVAPIILDEDIDDLDECHECDLDWDGD